MRITVVGGGNIGTQFAVHCAEKKHEVTVFTSNPHIFNRVLKIVDEKGNTIHEGTIARATSVPEEAFKTAEVVFIIVPANLMRKTATLVEPYVYKGMKIGIVPGSGGGELAFRRCVDRGAIVFGLERVPAIARLIKKGSIVRSTGYRKELHISSIPIQYVEECSQLISSIFDMTCVSVPNYLNLTMTPSNPILHTTRLKTLFHDYQKGKSYKRIPLFYEEWDDASSELLLACDAEVQDICKALPEFQLHYVKSLREHYESPTIKLMTKKISSIPAFKGITTPSVQVEDGYIPDLHSRYFTADFSYGLYILQQLGKIANVATPNIDETMAWYRGISLEKDEFCFSDYGIHSVDDLVRFYMMTRNA